ncbi:hypothetical protein JCM10212_004217 [Sporobolomyces blumeae]
MQEDVSIASSDATAPSSSASTTVPSESQRDCTSPCAGANVNGTTAPSSSQTVKMDTDSPGPPLLAPSQPPFRPLSQLPFPTVNLQPRLPSSPTTASPGASHVPQATPNLSQATRRTEAEIRANREKALKRKQEREDQKKREETIQIKLERESKRRELAKSNLAAFGFKIGPGISRYGSGKGGVVEEGVDEPPKKVEEWKPDARCSDEQVEVLEQVKRGGNVFFTGSAGVGKSFLLNEITRLLDHLMRPYQITATTGIAALQVNGTTVHSWASVGLGHDPIHTLYDRITRSPEREKNWTGVKTLIIDEISMSSPELFTKLNILAKLIRRDPRAFGGLQLIVSGDFYQLPPVREKHDSQTSCMRCGHKCFIKIPLHDARVPYEKRPDGIEPASVLKCVDKKTGGGKVFPGCLLEWRTRTFVFETEAWAECDFKVMELTKVFRQSDPEFIAMLEKIRRGECDESCVELLKGCGTELGQGGSIKIRPTNLYPIRADVDKENNAEFRKLKEEEFTFKAIDAARGEWAKQTMKSRLDSVPANPELKLKKGAQVLLLANLDVKAGLVNGSRGVIVDWIPRDIAPTVEDEAATNASKRSQGGSKQVGSEEWRAKAEDSYMDQQEKEYYPLVFFASGQEVIIRPHSWCIDLDKFNTVARTQLPLHLAWALTIHKSQGQSLDAVCVRLTGTFEKGQAYVALSRCRTPAGMRVEGFRPGIVMAHPTVKVFYQCIAEKKPFFITPVAPTNALSYVPDWDPLISKLLHKFGKVPSPLPVGSAVLAPGQAVPGLVASGLVLSTAAAAARGKKRSPSVGAAEPPGPAKSRTWQALLREAASSYVSEHSTGGAQPPMEPFLALAGSSLIGALETSAASTDGDAESTVDSQMAVDGTEVSAAKVKKEKKKRSRKGRVGH